MHDVLSKAKTLDGDERDALIAGAIEKLERRIQKEQQFKDKLNSLKGNREKIPAAGGTLAENDFVILKMACPEERDCYIEVSYECSPMKSMFKNDEFKEDLWENFINENVITASIYDKKNKKYVGYCMIKNIYNNDWEIAIEEKEEYRNMGYGYSALSLFINQLTKIIGQRFYRAQIDIDNTASQNLFKKLGAYPNGISEFWLHGDALKEFQKENIDCIDENIRNIADEFCVDPEELLGHVLEYRIDTSNNLLFTDNGEA